jgi:hypothetical protein
MQQVLIERKYRMNLGNFALRKKYLGQLVAQMNNESLELDLSPDQRTKLYNSIIQATKILNDVDKDSSLEDLEKRISILEESRKAT